ncbi:P-loop containing nucleoside triphosphate hydrolase [Sesbania bispinosa]|nr:P-loop containing nucleoside triphosphate hydrolase [Sesbania bispinosa]
MGKKSSTNATANQREDSLALVHEAEQPQPQPLAVVALAPIVSSYNDRIRPVLDAVENLRCLNIAKEGIQLPTIVVVGDQSSGKSSVLESLAGISLPRGQGICTRVPLIMRLQNHPLPKPELVLEFNGKTILTDEAHVSTAINVATEELAGFGKGISITPLTLFVKKNGVPDISMVDLPPEESIILNVLSPTVDFTTCESIRMSQSVDKTGLRTLAVVTRVDKSPEGLLEKVTADDVNIGLGYVCVRNRIVLAQKLVQVQAMIISKTLPEIVKKINEKLADAMSTFVLIVGLSRDSLRKILLSGEFDEYPEDKHMHCPARLVEMLDSYASDLYNCAESDATKDFLMDEIEVLEEAKSIRLPNFLPRTAFLATLHKKLQVSACRAGQNLIAKKKENSSKHVMEAIEMEKRTDYTCNPEYKQEYNKLISCQDAFLNQVLDNYTKPSHVMLEGVGNIDVCHLRDYPHMLSEAFDLKVRMIAYWKIVQRRLIDNIALHLMLSINDLVNKDLQKEICDDMLSPSGGGIERMLEESPAISGKREKLSRSVKVLKESKKTIANIIDRIGSYGNK